MVRAARPAKTPPVYRYLLSTFWPGLTFSTATMALPAECETLVTSSRKASYERLSQLLCSPVLQEGAFLLLSIDYIAHNFRASSELGRRRKTAGFLLMNVRQGSVLDGKRPQRDEQPQLARMHVLKITC